LFKLPGKKFGIKDLQGCSLF